MNEIMGILVSIFGRSGIGHATEYAFHNTIIGSRFGPAPYFQ